MFIKCIINNITGITESWIRTVNSKMKEFNEGIIKEDQRGKHHVRPEIIPSIVKEGVRKHIEPFPVVSLLSSIDKQNLFKCKSLFKTNVYKIQRFDERKGNWKYCIWTLL